MNMKLRILAATALLATLGGTARAESFVRPILSYDSPTNAGFGSAMGYGVAFGTWFGAGKDHEVSFEWHYTDWNYSQPYSGYSVAGGEKNMPLLVNYRYQSGNAQSPVRFYIGPSLGFTRTHLQVTANFPTFAPGPAIVVDETDWSFTWSGATGIIVKISDRADLDIGYRYLHFQGRNFGVGSSNVVVDDHKANIAYLGVNFRF